MLRSERANAVLLVRHGRGRAEVRRDVPNSLPERSEGSELHVVRRAQRLDRVVFEQRGFQCAGREYVLDLAHLREHFRGQLLTCPSAEMTADALLQASGFADVQ